MTKPTGKPVGRPPTGKKKMNKTLGSVAVTDEMLDDCTDAAALEGVNRATWIRETLSKAIARSKKKQAKEN